jgi:hypothetical protein
LGPYSGELTADVRELVRGDLLDVEKIPGRQHGAYVTTFEGEERAASIWSGLNPEEQRFLRAVRSYVTSKSFSHLLREVYAEYPDYAANSQFTG